MDSLTYWRVDVFADVPFGGNPLAVFPEADSLSGDEMQKLAMEMSLPETCFVVKASDPSAKFRLRIFSTTMELPMAGHPEVGAHFVLATHGYYDLHERHNRVFHELGGGVFPVDIHVQDGKVERVMITLARPQFRQPVDDINPLAKAVGIDPEHITSTRLPVRIVSTGLDHMIIPVTSLKAIESVEPVPSLLKRLAVKYATSMFYLFTLETMEEGSNSHSRLFTAGTVSSEVSEDPAAGGASGALAAYLIRHKLVHVFRRTSLLNEQGYEMGRPSKIFMEVDTQDGFCTSVRVGGRVVPVAEGRLSI